MKKFRRINPQNEPTSLYNAMVAPYIQYPIKGVLWYQGESNAGHPKLYKEYMLTLIRSWRKVFNNPELPFIYAQLPNFMDVSYLPEESNWAEMRQSQLDALTLPNTAMTVNIDLGEWNDIHPDDKKGVGERMALAGLKLAYGNDIVYSGPIYKDYTVDGNKVIITFSHTGSGLITKDLLGLRYDIYGLDGLILVLTISFFPVAYLTLLGMMRALDPSLEEAATSLGAGKWRVFRTVILPMLVPGIASSFLLLFVEEIGRAHV